MKYTSRNKCWLAAEWPAPAHIRAGTSTRLGGSSKPPYDSFNLAKHVGDDNECIYQNREQLRRLLQLPSEPFWLDQNHSGRVIKISDASSSNLADAAYTQRPGIVCTVLTADCVPILICNREGREIAAIHAGWKGLCRNIILNTLACFDSGPDRLMAWIGPHISSEYYEVRDDVRHAVIDSLSESMTVAFKQTNKGSWLADLGLITRLTLAKAGVNEIHTSNFCTYREMEYFYSYRRENKTGRMASLIWIDDSLIS